MEFEVSLSAPSAVPVSVSFSTGAPGDTAIASQDYSASADTLVIPAGSTTAPIPVDVLPAAFNPTAGGGAEPAESFTLALSSPSNATLADGQATGTITTEDESPCQDEGSQPPPGIDSGGSFFANLCVGDTGDDYSIHLSAGEGIQVRVVPHNADDDPEISVTPPASLYVVGGSAGGPGATDTMIFQSPVMSASFTLSVVHGDDHTPARAEGYYISASDYP